MDSCQKVWCSCCIQHNGLTSESLILHEDLLSIWWWIRPFAFICRILTDRFQSHVTYTHKSLEIYLAFYCLFFFCFWFLVYFYGPRSLIRTNIWLMYSSQSYFNILIWMFGYINLNGCLFEFLTRKKNGKIELCAGSLSSSPICVYDNGFFKYLWIVHDCCNFCLCFFLFS